MTIKRLVSGLIAFSLVISALPARAETGGGLATAAAPSGPGTFRTSLDRAAASAAAAQVPSKGTPFGSASRTLKRPEFASEDAGRGQGATGGGGGGMSITAIIMTLVGTAAGVGATVYMLKQLKKTAHLIVQIEEGWLQTPAPRES